MFITYGRPFRCFGSVIMVACADALFPDSSPCPSADGRPPLHLRDLGLRS